MPAFHDVAKPLVAMIHLPPLPGAANYGGTSVRDIAARAAKEATILQAAGFDGVMIQNTHDRPSRERVVAGTLAALASVATAVREAVSFEVGINAHKNDAEAGLAAAASAGGSFVRVKVLIGAVIGPEGIIQGAVARALDVRRDYATDIEIWADLYELTSWQMGDVSLEVLADMTARFGQADRLIVTDPTVDASVAAVQRVRTATDVPVLVGGRTDPVTVAAALAGSDGVIVGTCLREGARTDAPLDEAAIERFMAAARPETVAA